MDENLPNNSPETPETQPPKNRARFALIRIIAALILACLMLTISGFAIIPLLKGPEKSFSVTEETEGDFVTVDIPAILGFFADDARGSRVDARYGFILVNGEFLAVRFTSRYLDSADAVLNATYAYINGETEGLDNFISVQGTIEPLSEDQAALAYDWFGLNYDQLLELYIISETDDYANYISDYMITVDTVGGRSQTLVIATSAVAGALLLYALVELVLLGVGFYKPKKAAVIDSDAILTKYAESDGESSEPEADSEALPESDGESSEPEPDSEALPESDGESSEPEADSEPLPETDGESSEPEPKTEALPETDGETDGV
ncbi:MAG: procyclic acidic repetitive family protein [Oscillospiraceae bacterium]|jgi:hypothetical protein|nr:procyclic acidic repetitive family protein [Oscillospiraceae bacterium]